MTGLRDTGSGTTTTHSDPQSNAACVHEWVDQPIRCEQRQMIAYVGDNPEPQEVTGTMVYDERCAKCGVESGWPT